MGPPNTEKCNPEEWGPEGWGAQNFAFFPLPPPFRSFCVSLSGCLLVEFRWFFEATGPEMCTFGEPKRAHFTVPTFKKPTEIPRRRQRNGSGRGKKKRNFRRFGGGWFGAGFQTNNNHNKHNHNNTNSGPNPEEVWGPPRIFGQNTKTLKLAKVGLAKVGHDHEQMVQRMN